MIVRLADEQDAPGLIELARQVEDWFGPMAGDPGFRAVLDRHIGPGTALVAVDAGQAGLLGGLLFSARPPVYHVRWLVVSGPARGQGVGRSLIEHALAFFRAQGLRLARIETLAHNEVGRHLYPSAGFVEVARQVHYVMPLETEAASDTA